MIGLDIDSIFDSIFNIEYFGAHDKSGQIVFRAVAKHRKIDWLESELWQDETNFSILRFKATVLMSCLEKLIDDIDKSKYDKGNSANVVAALKNTI